ncbi:biogenesis of lysosome-related organelles complex 1 subunit 4 isoform X2 [Sitophilus oryzae]|uniref:Biogenesis of lysosome-related organelles complex 1 subunit 4 isoform X2 n=1 Tax=Sitophilus oryzae TaxID=7048 RepID=A0A6J2YHA6_SITOR|nr:biogenesis of lysosome-related organelles complex 1 subunit 4 isoform X2 [Sitophilus oryzae]
MKEGDVEKTAKDYSKYITDIDLAKKLEPINKSIDDMLTRLEEFETMFTFIQPDVKDSSDLLSSMLQYKPEFDQLCEKIDSTEFLVEHIKSNLDALESRIEEGEIKLNAVDTASRVTNMLSPLFMSINEKKTTAPPTTELFKVEDYFQ